MKHKVLLLLVFVSLSIPQFLYDIENTPNEGDEKQYWEIGYGIYNEGQYKRATPDKDKSDFEKIQLGFRRGEPIYPFLIASSLKLFNFNNNENCTSIDCHNLNPAKNFIVIISYILRLLIIALSFDTLTKKYRPLTSYLLCIALLLMLPIEIKDLITVTLLTLSLYFYPKKEKVSYLFFSLIPLSNAVFLYILPLSFFVYFMFNKNNLKNSLLKILILLLPSLLWMTRNFVEVNQFSITGRSAEVLSIRAEYSTMDYTQIKSGIVYYTPGTPFVFEAIQSRVWNLVTENGSDVLYDRQNPDSAYKKAKKLTGEVGERLENYTYDNDSYVSQQEVINEISFEILKENFYKHTLLSFVFGYRGMFPSINYKIIDYYSIFEINSLTLLFKEVMSFLRLIFIPYGLFKLSTNFSKSRSNLASLIFLSLWGFFAFFTHFIPRYSTFLLIPSVFYLASINLEKK